MRILSVASTKQAITFTSPPERGEEEDVVRAEEAATPNPTSGLVLSSEDVPDTLDLSWAHEGLDISRNPNPPRKTLLQSKLSLYGVTSCEEQG